MMMMIAEMKGDGGGVEVEVVNIARHELPNGYCFLAVTKDGEFSGTWAKARDLVEAVRKVHKGAGYPQKTEVTVAVWYVYSRDTWVGDMGNLVFELDRPPQPVGLFKASLNKGVSLRCGDTNDQWMADQLSSEAKEVV
jgi:hypothetical protein